ncbi:MAG TPA: PilZ domain-containing protein [Rhizomicrobium sp.]|nr:PilZ domain-containing protein [Rhizomicrobium sp.]
MTVDREAMLAKVQQDRRRLLRVPVNLGGRLFCPTDQREADCTVLEMSPGTAHLECEIVPPPDTTVVVYIEGFGRFDAVVVRSLKNDEADGKFGVRFHCSALKRERVAEQLAHYVESGTLEDTNLRRHDRMNARGFASFTRVTGEIVNCEVLDLSLSGVSLGTPVRPQIGEIVLIGQVAGRVMRLHENGIGIEFITPPQDKTPSEQTVAPDALL